MSSTSARLMLVAWVPLGAACSEIMDPNAGRPPLPEVTNFATYAYVANARTCRGPGAPPPPAPCNEVFVIRTGRNTVLETVPVTSGQFAVETTPDGAFAYVALGTTNPIDPQPGRIVVIDTERNRIVGAIASTDNPSQIVFSPDGTRAYVATFGLKPFGQPRAPSYVTVIETTGNTIATTIPIGTSLIAGIALSPDGRRLYVGASDPNAIRVIDTGTNSLVETIPLTDPPGAVASTPDGATLYVAHCDENAVSVIDAESRTVTNTVTSSGLCPAGIVFTADGAVAYIAYLGDDVAVVDAATHTVQTIIHVAGAPSGMALTPDGDFLYVANQGPNTLVVIETATNTVVAAIPVGHAPVDVALATIPL